MEIKILGKGCPKCKRLEEITREVVSEMGLEASFSKVSDVNEIMAYDIVATPGLVLDEKVLSSGRLPSKTEIKSLISGAVGQ
jgi:small redox-active disulfide protein 2